ncbi:MAG: CoA-transferase, partial [Nitrospinota bacterium]
QDGEIKLIEDYSNYGFALRTVAGRYGWPFAPMMGELGTDLLEYDVFGKAGLRGKKDARGDWEHPSIAPKKFAVVDDPFEGWGYRPHAFAGGDTTANQTSSLEVSLKSTKYTGKPGQKVVLLPPILPEVTIIRAQRAGSEGTVRLDGIWGPDCEQAMSSKYLIVECEQVVPEEELRLRPDHNHIGAHFVHAIVEQPFGGYPSAVPYYYDYDWDFWVNYGRVNRKSKEAVKEYWQKMVVETEDDWDFLANKVGTDYRAKSGKEGFDRLFELRADSSYGYKPDLARPI